MIVYEGLNNLVWFFGIVEATNDPTNNGRVRVRAFGFHPTVNEGTVEVDDLPWAIVLRASAHMHTPLDVGDTVVGVFMDGRDAQQPLVFGALTLPRFGVPTVRNPINPGGSISGYRGGEVLTGNPEFGAGSTEHAEEAYNYFINKFMQEKGLSREDAANIAAGIVGNLQAESGADLDTGAIGDGGAAWGIAQWHKPRRDDFERVFGIPFEQSTFQQQLDFIWWELQNTQQEAMNLLLGASSSSEAAIIFDQKYERSAGLSTQERVDNAAALLQEFGEGTINAEEEDPETEAPPEEGGEHPYMTAGNENLQTLGDGALPPQATGEQLDTTPAVAAAATARNLEYGDGGANETGYSTGARVSQPRHPVGGTYRTNVWNTRHNGSYIELHPGENINQEHITITHSSGSHVILDPNGNVTIHSVGKIHQSSTGDIESQADGNCITIADRAYAIFVNSGGVTISSVGDMRFTSGGDVRIQAAGDLLLNAGESIDVSGARIGITSRVDNIDILSGLELRAMSIANMSFKTEAGMAHQSDGKMSITSGEGIFTTAGSDIETSAGGNLIVNAGGVIGIESTGSTNIRTGTNLGLAPEGILIATGGTIQLNSPGFTVPSIDAPAEVDEATPATPARAPDPPAHGFATDGPRSPGTGGAGAAGTDDTVIQSSTAATGATSAAAPVQPISQSNAGNTGIVPTADSLYSGPR